MKDKCIGCMVGLAVGDALGTSIEFSERDKYLPVKDMIGGGVFGLNPGEWTDDTSMALALADSILEKGTIDKPDIMRKFKNWYKYGEYSHNGWCFDIGNTTVKALRNYILNGYSDAEPNENLCGNGSIMRLAPVPIYWHKDKKKSKEMAIKQSLITHSHQKVLKCVGDLSDIIIDAMNSKDIGYDELIGKNRKDIKSSGYVVDTLEAAIWAVKNTSNFKDAVLLAVNLGDDADTVGAVAGQIAGAKYGLSSIPKEWVEILAWKDKILQISEMLYEKSEE